MKLKQPLNYLSNIIVLSIIATPTTLLRYILQLILENIPKISVTISGTESAVARNLFDKRKFLADERQHLFCVNKIPETVQALGIMGEVQTYQQTSRNKGCE